MFMDYPFVALTVRTTTTRQCRALYSEPVDTKRATRLYAISLRTLGNQLLVSLVSSSQLCPPVCPYKYLQVVVLTALVSLITGILVCMLRR